MTIPETLVFEMVFDLAPSAAAHAMGFKVIKEFAFRHQVVIKSA
jgi:hypothetical protein